MKTIMRVTIPLIVVAAGIVIGLVLLRTGPEAQRRPPRAAVPTVKVTTINPREYTVLLHSRGTVSPRTQSTLIPEISGRINQISTNFRNGGFFAEGEVLVRIDPRDYEYALTVARAELERARVALAEEQAQSEQAQRDWEKLKLQGAPSDLVLRRPQLQSARAAAAAAEARVNRAELDLQRTAVRAPYAGRVLEQRVDVGQFVSTGTVLASLYAVDYVEVRLPITDRQAAFVNLPESYRDEPQQQIKGPAVTVAVSVGGKTFSWQGRVVRTEGSIDTRSRQLFVVAQIDDPYAKQADERPPLKVGQFVTAIIEGRKLPDVFVVPRLALMGLDELLVVHSDDTVERRRVEIVWRDEEDVIVNKGLKDGERISLTLLPFITNGSKVEIAGAPGSGTRDDAKTGDRRDKKGKRGNKKKSKPDAGDKT